MKKITIGFLPLYIKLYDDVSVNRRPLELFYEKSAKMFEDVGFNVIRTSVCRVKEEFSTAVKEYEEKGADVIVTLHLAYSPSLESIDALANTKLPIVVLDTTESIDFPPMKDTDALMLNHGIHGVMDMCNLLKQRGKKYAVASGHYDNSNVFKKTVDFIKAGVAAKSLFGSKTGVIGGSFDGMGDFLISKEEAKKTFGIEIVDATDKELSECMKSVTDAEIKSEIEEYEKEFKVAGNIDKELLNLSVRSCLAVRKWIENNKLDAFSINFLGVNNNNIKTMPFVECCKGMKRGLGYAGEGDALTASFVGAVAKTFEKTSFVEIFCPDWKGNRLFISHMGEMNYAVADGKPVLEKCDFIYTDAEDCYKGYARFMGGQAVFCNVFFDGKEWCLLLSDVYMNEVKEDAFTTSMRGWFSPKSSVSEFLENLSEVGATHHSFMVYDVHVSALKYFGALAGLKVKVI